MITLIVETKPLTQDIASLNLDVQFSQDGVILKNVGGGILISYDDFF